MEPPADSLPPADPPAEPPRPPALYVERLSKSYAGTRALNALSFRLEPGRILGLVGPNGAGKTTALRSIAGVLPIQEGRVLVCGHDVAAEEVQAKRCLGWVPDDPEPFDALTVWEHLEFTAALFRVFGSEVLVQGIATVALKAAAAGVFFGLVRRAGLDAADDRCARGRG